VLRSSGAAVKEELNPKCEALAKHPRRINPKQYPNRNI
jgi:hypothetical protein